MIIYMLFVEFTEHWKMEHTKKIIFQDRTFFLYKTQSYV